MANVSFKVRKWSDTNEKSFDVIMIDHDNNRQHFQPGVTFSDEAKAHKHAANLTQAAINDSTCVKFIQDHWPQD